MDKIFITSSKDLSALITSTYIWAIIIGVIAFGLILLISSLISFEGGKTPKDPRKRRIWFYVIGFISIAAFFIYHYLLVMTLLRNPAFKGQFFTHIIVSSVIVFLLYFILAFSTAKIFKRSKLATIFPSK